MTTKSFNAACAAAELAFRLHVDQAPSLTIRLREYIAVVAEAIAEREAQPGFVWGETCEYEDVLDEAARLIDEVFRNATPSVLFSDEVTGQPSPHLTQFIAITMPIER